MSAAVAVLATVQTIAQTVVPRQAGNWGHVFGGWAAVIAIMGVYVFVLLRRGRRLSQRLRPEDRRWID